MAKTATPKEGMKIVSLGQGMDREVPESLQLGEDCWFYPGEVIGENCVLGNDVSFRGRLGNNVRIGNHVNLERVDIPDNTTIGSNVAIAGGVKLPTGITIGNNVVLIGEIEVRPGVNIPDNWAIHCACTVNPGPDGFPVVIVAPPRFHCNVTASRPGF